jgi:2-octaprenyl-6-methoxyphenol hydroxylase
MMTDETRTKVAVAGSGPAGMIAALAFASHGFDVVALGPAPSGEDRRTTALMMPSISYLETLGVWADIEPQAAPLVTMRIVDATSRLIRASTVSFQAAEIDEQAFGYNIPNAVLNDVLVRAVSGSPHITRHEAAVTAYRHGRDEILIDTAEGAKFAAKLVVAADGRASRARDSAGISVRSWRYPQTAVVLNFEHALDHGNISTEFHTESGPVVQVPLPGRRSSLVWVTTPREADELMSLSDEELSLRVEERISSILGRVTVEAGRQAWPLSALVPAAFARDRIALVGEAAHVFPPIGAQGLNLGIRDAESLAAQAVMHPDDPGSASALRAYDMTRRPDVFLRTGAVDALNRSLLSAFLPAQLARSVGLEILRAVPPLRGLFMREGMRPGSGFRLPPSMGRKEVRR